MTIKSRLFIVSYYILSIGNEKKLPIFQPIKYTNRGEDDIIRCFGLE